MKLQHSCVNYENRLKGWSSLCWLLSLEAPCCSSSSSHSYSHSSPHSLLLPLHLVFYWQRKFDIVIVSSRSFTGARRHTLHPLSSIRQRVPSKEDEKQILMIYTPILTFNLCLKTLWLKLQNILLSQRCQLPRFTLSKFKLNSEEYGTGEIIYNLLSCQPFLWAEDNTHLYSCYILLGSSIFHIPQDWERGARGERCLLSSQVPGRMNNVNKARSLPSGPP